MEDKDTEYELMKRTKEIVSSVFPNGFDEDTATVGRAKQVIQWLLKNDLGIKGLILSKKPICHNCGKKLMPKDDYINYRGHVYCAECSDKKGFVTWFL